VSLGRVFRVFRGPAVPVLLAVAVVGVSAAGTAALMADPTAEKSTPKVPPPVRNAAWTVDAAHDADSLTALSGAWVTDALVVRGGADGLHAVQRKDRSTAWDLPVSADGGSVCAMSPTVDGGIGVISYTATFASLCTSVSGVELSTGHVLWTAQTPAAFGVKEANAAAVAVDHGIALVDSSNPGAADPKGVASVIGLDARSGAAKWKHTTTCIHSSSSLLAGGGQTTLVEACGSAVNVVTLDSASGSQTRSVTSPQLKSSAAPVSLTPLVVADTQNQPTALAFPGPAGAAGTTAPMTVTPAAGLDSLFDSLTSGGFRLPRAASGGAVVCAGNPHAVCWDSAGKQLVLRGLPDTAADVVAVAAPPPAPASSAAGTAPTAAATRFITLPTPARPRAALCRVAADGKVVVEEELSLPVSAFLTRAGATQVTAYGDATDLVLVSVRPSTTAVIDVR
jgi:hypothetical protein